MDNIKQIVRLVIGNISVNKSKARDHLQRIWDRVLDEKELRHTHLLGESGGTVTVLVDTPAWLYQMNAKKKMIMERIQVDFPTIKNIHFKIGNVK